MMMMRLREKRATLSAKLARVSRRRTKWKKKAHIGITSSRKLKTNLRVPRTQCVMVTSRDVDWPLRCWTNVNQSSSWNPAVLRRPLCCRRRAVENATAESSSCIESCRVAFGSKSESSRVKSETEKVVREMWSKMTAGSTECAPEKYSRLSRQPSKIERLVRIGLRSLR